MLEKLQFECKQYKLYSPDSLKYITDNMHNILLAKIEEYKLLFNLDELEQIQINYFDDNGKFRNFIYELRGETESLPSYAAGTYDNGMINAFIQNDIDINSPKYKNELYLAGHELFHILYMKYILKYDYSKRIVWYDEGMAQFLSGENDHLNDDSNLKKFYLFVKDKTKIIPNFNNIEHGEDFCNEFYDGYDLSYLCVRYLNEILTADEFKILMSNFSKIKQYGTTVLNDMFEYYDHVLLSKKK